MHFFINELSFVGQAKDSYEADNLMMNVLEIIKQIQPIQCNDPIQTHSSFSNKELFENFTISQWLFQTLKSEDRRKRTIAQILIRILKQGPFIDVSLPEIELYRCYFKSQNYSSSSLTGAAYTQGKLISLQNATNFELEYIQIEFGTEQLKLVKSTLHNLTTIEQSRKIRPIYKLHVKHNFKGSWEYATPMDLNDKESQELLDNSTEEKGSNSKKRYGYHRTRNKFYVFHSDNVSDEKGHPIYHGYPIIKDQVPSDIISLLFSQ